MRVMLLIAVMLCSAARASAQSERADTTHAAVFVEFLGNGGLYSVNIEHRIVDDVLVRAGIARWESGGFGGSAGDRFLTAPVTFSVLRGERHSKLEVGLGVMVGRRNLGRRSGAESFRNITGIFGYRYEPDDRRVLFRFVLTPFFPLKGDYPSDSALLSVGMSAGFQF